jgi:hypothetical protein
MMRNSTEEVGRIVALRIVYAKKARVSQNDRPEIKPPSVSSSVWIRMRKARTRQRFFPH